MIHNISHSINLSFTELKSLEYFIIKILLANLTAFFICFAIGPWILHYLSLTRIKQYIRKEGPKKHYKKDGTPTMGGILILISIFISTIIWIDLKNQIILIVLFSTISFGIIGFIDDYIMQIKKHNHGLGVIQKLLLQIGAATIISLCLYTIPEINSSVKLSLFGNLQLNLKWLYIPFSILVIIGTSNAINLTDGLDGMAIGTTIIAQTAYMIFAFISGHNEISALLGSSYMPENMDLAIYCSISIGAGIGFLWLNSHPAQIFMGDVGSLSLGASLGTIALITKNEIILILIGGVFVIETISVILQIVFFKITKGNRLLKMAPIHHHFELKGMSESKIVIRSWIIGIILAIIAIILKLKFSI